MISRCRNLWIIMMFLLAGNVSILWAQNADSAFMTAMNNYNARQYVAAVEGFRSFLNVYPNDPRRIEATFRLAESYRELQDYANAGTNYDIVMQAGLGNEYARQALFRVGEIPYLLGAYDQAKPLLLNYLTSLNQDPNLVFVLYYLGNIGLAQNSPAEAEYYFQLGLEFDDWLTGPPKGERRNESRLGLAMAKNRLGKYAEADDLYRQLALDPVNPLAADAYGRWGLSQYDRHAFSEAASTLQSFLGKYPTSVLRSLAEETLAKCYIELKDNQRALDTLQRMNPKTDNGQLLEVRVLFLMKRVDDGKRLLDQLDRMLGVKHRDKLEALKVNLAYDQSNWQELIRLVTALGQIRYDSVLQRMTIGYYENPSASGVEKLPQDAFLKLCQALAIAYARTGDTNQANATYAAMNVLARSGDPVLAEIVRQTSVALNAIVPNIGVGGSNDAIHFRQAQDRYNARDYAGTITILVSLLNVQYVEYDKKMTINYSPYVPGFGGGDNGKLSEDALLDACQMLVLSYAYGGDSDRSVAAMSEMDRLCKDGNSWHQNLLRQTRIQLRRIPRSDNPGTSPGNSDIAGDRNRWPDRDWSNRPGSGRPGSRDPDDSLRNGAQLQQVIAECQTLFKQRRYADVDAKLKSLLMQSASDAVIAEAACLRGQALFALHRDKDAIVMGKLSLEKEPSGRFAADALWMTGMAHVLLDESADALPYFDRLAKEHPQHEHVDGALYYLAVDEMDSGDSRKANTRFQKIYRSHPNGDYWSHAAWQLAYAAYKRNDLDAADVYLRKLLGHPPNEAVVDRALFLKGQIAYEKKLWHTAQIAFAEVSRAAPESPLSDWAALAARRAVPEKNEEIKR